jgi:hypothetical protein
VFCILAILKKQGGIKVMEKIEKESNEPGYDELKKIRDKISEEEGGKFFIQCQELGKLIKIKYPDCIHNIYFHVLVSSSLKEDQKSEYSKEDFSGDYSIKNFFSSNYEQRQEILEKLKQELNKKNAG